MYAIRSYYAMAHEDDPVRALRAALEMGEHISQFNQDNGTNLGLHIGVITSYSIHYTKLYDGSRDVP